MRKSRRADAITELNKVAQAQERWRANNPNYNNADVSSAATGLRLVTGTTVALNYTLASGYYTITIGNATASPTTYRPRQRQWAHKRAMRSALSLTLTMTSGNVAYWAVERSHVADRQPANQVLEPLMKARNAPAWLHAR